MDRIDFTFDEYEAGVIRTTNKQLNWDDVVSNCLLGLSGEVGEIAEHIKKFRYHGKGLDHEHIKLELGDVLFYVTWLADAFGFDLMEVAKANNEKLRKRYAEGFSVEASLNRID